MRFLFFLLASVTLVSAQTAPSDSAPYAPNAPITTNSSNAAEALGLGNLTFTNSAGTTYSVAQLKTQLETLRHTVEQTLPMLTAFVANSTNTITSAKESIGQTVSSILRSLNRNAGGASTNRLEGALQNLTGSNNSTAAGNNPNTLADLQALQNELSQITNRLQDLHISGYAPETRPETPNYLTPTGRQ